MPNETPATVNNNNNTWTESKSFFLSVIGLVSGLLGIGLSVGAIAIVQNEAAHLQQALAENTKQVRLLDNDWQIMNAWLAAHHIVKDVHGNYHLEGEK